MKVVVEEVILLKLILSLLIVAAAFKVSPDPWGGVLAMIIVLRYELGPSMDEKHEREDE